jgi:hypothetical protein
MSAGIPPNTPAWRVTLRRAGFRPVVAAGVAAWVGLALGVTARGQSQSKPAFQYASGDIRVGVPTADEPRVREFGPASLRLAARYMEEGAVSWVREKSCVNCHTTGPYLAERTAWTKAFGKPSAEVLADFVASVPKEVVPVRETEVNGHKHHPGTFSSVWRSLGLAEWDRHITGRTSEPTDRSLRDMFERQSDQGAFVSHGEVEIPHITTDFELTLQAVRAACAAPGWLAGLEDDVLRARVAKMKLWLRNSAPKNDFDRILKLQLAHYLPELVPQPEREAALALLSSKQHSDGGWSTRDLSPIHDWHFEVSPAVSNLIRNLSDAARPESDAYLTALAIVLFRQSDVPVADPRVRRGLAWLRREQRESGRWWMHSLYRGNYHYITYIATAQAVKAFALCGELPGEAPLIYDSGGIPRPSPATARFANEDTKDRDGSPAARIPLPRVAASTTASGAGSLPRRDSAGPAQGALDLTRLRNPVWTSDDNLRDPSVLKLAEGYLLFYSRLAGTNWASPGAWSVASAFTADFVRFENDRDVSPKGHASPGDVVEWHGRFILPYQTYPSHPTGLCFGESPDFRVWSAPRPFLAEARLLPWNTLGRVIDPTLVRDGETLHCFFVGSAMVTNASGKSLRANLLGHALTRDPEVQRWELLSTRTPMLGVSERAPDGVENVMVFRTGDHWTMIYSEGLADQHLALATSTDLRAWELGGPIELPRQKWMARKHGAPFVWREADQWLMILMGESATRRTTFGLLTSPDGGRWTPLPE